ncbi:MurR/RpiR family transcriptional regulator [Sulfidibacter corallicola]|uniref:MurR/RpiR family transcriptional regulator n=1 Tax=Sulfidibacter corallicola TaxID=2818388 RepID=A0A8A4TGH5_SULCO|nr:MurR/RpiR family transcriptional regulator [Sulfidibacter corallicola]QTD47891.1 MurR/RpiR family transcriptional regulator [Sulfidibacter corallicola]
MAPLTNEAEFKDLVLKAFNDLPAQQQQVAEYMVEHLDEVPFLTVPTLAKHCGVSEATIVRFAQRVGYDGFSGMKTNLTDMVRDRVTSSRGTGLEEALAPAGTDSLSLVVQQEMQNLQSLAKDVDLDVFEEAAATLFQSGHIFTFGFGISAHLAGLATYLLTQIGLRASTLSTRFSAPLEQMIVMRETDALLLFSFPPFSVPTIKMAEQAAARGIKVVAISDRLTAPVAPFADHLIQVRTHNRMFTNAIGAVSVFLNALITEIALKHGDHAAEAMTKINRILATDENVIQTD